MKQFELTIMGLSIVQIVSFLLIGISLIMILVASCKKSNNVAGYKLMKIPMVVYIIELSVITIAFAVVYVYLFRNYIDCVDFVKKVMDINAINKADKIAEFFGKDLDKYVTELALEGKNYYLDSWAVALIMSILKALDYNLTAGWFCIILTGVFFIVLTVLNYMYFGKIIKSMNVIINILKNPTAPIRRNVSLFVVVYSFFFGIIINILHSSSLTISSVSINPVSFLIRYLFIICCGLALGRYRSKINEKIQ